MARRKAGFFCAPVSDRPPERKSSPSLLGRVRGRIASGAELRQRLASATPDCLWDAMDNPALATDENEMVQLLRNRSTPRPLLQRIGADPSWTRSASVRRCLVLHAGTPPAMARDLALSLSWADLVELSNAPAVSPSLRRYAEQLLRARLEGTTLGQRIALARRAPRGLIDDVIGSGEGPVLCGLLANARLVEADVIRIASSRSTPPELFARLSQDERWGFRRAVRVAIAANVRTPIPIALRILRQLPRLDLQRLSNDYGTPRIVRIGADRLLQGAAEGPI